MRYLFRVTVYLVPTESWRQDTLWCLHPTMGILTAIFIIIKASFTCKHVLIVFVVTWGQYTLWCLDPTLGISSTGEPDTRGILTAIFISIKASFTWRHCCSNMRTRYPVISWPTPWVSCPPGLSWPTSLLLAKLLLLAGKYSLVLQ